MADEDLVNVVDPDTGQIGSIPSHQYNEAASQGFTQASPEQVQGFVRNQKYGSTSQQLVTGLEGAASAATFGASTAIERGLGVNPEDIRQRREENPGSHMLGQAAGLVGSSFLLPGAGAAGALEAAGGAGVKALGLGAAETVGGRIGSAAVKSAIENTLFQAGDEVSKALSSDPNQSLETAATNVGLSGIIGGGFGAGIGAVSPLWEATAGKRLRGLLSDVTNEAHGVSVPEGAVSTLPEHGFQENAVGDLAGGLKPNAEEISGAASRLGVKPTAATLSNSEFIGRMEDSLIKRPTIFGEKAAKESQEVFQKLNKAGSETLKGATNLSEAQVGKEIKEGMVKKLSDELAPIETGYKKLESYTKAMEISDGLKQGAAQNLLSHELVSVAPSSDAANAARTIAKEIEGLQNVDQIKTYRTLINKRISKAVMTGGEELPIFYAAKNELTALRESAIDEAAKATGIGRGANKISSEMIEDLRGLDKSYRDIKTKLKDVGREAGLGKLGSVRELLEKFTKLPDEAFATRIFDAGDINQLNYFKENFPKQFEQARSYKLKEILEKSIDEAQGKNGKFSVGKYLRQLSDTKMNPEARDVLLGDNVQKFKDIKTMFQALPENFNPSGTASAHSFGHMFSPQGFVDNAADAVKYAVLKGLPYMKEAAGSESSKATGLATMMALASGKEPSSTGFKAMVDYIAKTIKGETLVNEAAKNVFKSGKEVFPQKYLADDKRIDRLDKKLKELNADSTPLLKTGGDVGHYMPGHAQSFGSLAGNAVAYLNSLRPDNTPKAPLDHEIPPSKFQKENYRSALKIAEQPLMLLEHIKDGSISPDSIGHLNAIYPNLYLKLSQKLMNNVMDAKTNGEEIPYRTRMGLSMFLGEPLDTTMTPQAIQATQPQVQQSPQANQAQMKQGPHSMKNIGKLASAELTPDQARLQSKNKN